MSEVKKRKVHGADFKAKVGLEAIRGLKTLNEIGQDYGVHPVQVAQVATYRLGHVFAQRLAGRAAPGVGAGSGVGLHGDSG